MAELPMQTRVRELREQYAERLKRIRAAQRRGMIPQYASLLYQASPDSKRLPRPGCGDRGAPRI